MNRYKINVKFLIILLVLFVVMLGGGYGLWAFQVRRSAPDIKERAIKATEEKEWINAYTLWRRYLKYKENDFDARVRFATMLFDYAQENWNQPEVITESMSVAEDTLRSFPVRGSVDELSGADKENAERLDTLRREAIEMAMNPRIRRWDAATDHLNYLIDTRELPDPELRVERLQCYLGDNKFDQAKQEGFAMVGYDIARREFDVSRATAPHEPMAYVLLAQTLRKENPRAELADQVMNQLVAANPESHRAFLQRSIYWEGKEEMALARADWERAYNLDQQDGEPDVDVLIFGGRQLMQEEEVERALELGRKAVELYPDDVRGYVMLAHAQSSLEQFDEAMATLDEGLEHLETVFAQVRLAMLKADVQLMTNDVEGARESIAQLDQLRGIPLVSNLVKFYEGRALYGERKWFEASEKLLEARDALNVPQVAALYPTVMPTLDRFLGNAFDQLGQTDRAVRYYNLSLQSDPSQEHIARLVKALESKTKRSQDQRGTLTQRVATMKDLPASQQDWTEIEAFVQEQIDEQQLPESEQHILQARYRILRGQDDQGAEHIRKALAAKPKQGSLIYAIKLMHSLPQFTPEETEEAIQQGEQRFGSNAAFQLERAEMIVRERAEDADAQLWALESEAADWDDHQKVFFYNNLADYFRRIGKRHDAMLALERVHEVSPQDLNALMEMFQLARESSDNEGMQKAQAMILELVGTKDNDSWQYTEAARLLTLYAIADRDPKLLDQAEQLITSAEQKRPEWAALLRLRGSLNAVRNKIDEAIANYERAAQIETPRPTDILQHVRLLAAKQNYVRAKEVAEKLNDKGRIQVLGQLYPEILVFAGEQDKAIEYAEKVLELDAKNPTKQLWFSELLVRADRAQEANKPLQEALRLNPNDVKTWITWVRYLVSTDQRGEANLALQQAQLRLPADALPELLSQGYALLQRWQRAEAEYLNLYQADPDNLDRAQQIAMFYLSDAYGGAYISNSERVVKATPYLNQLMKAAGEDGVDFQDPHAQWARRRAAIIFAARGDYPSMLKAEELLRLNAVDGELPMEDRLEMARILSRRPEPGSRVKAANMLESVQATRPLDLDNALMLAKLYWVLEETNKASDQMQGVIARYGGSDPRRVYETYVDMLLGRGRYDDAERYHQRLFEHLSRPVLQSGSNGQLKIQNMTQADLRIINLTVRVWERMGRSKEARALLISLLPNDLSQLNASHAGRLAGIGALLVRLELYDDAEKVFRIFAKVAPDKALLYVRFLGIYKDTDKAFELLQTAMNDAREKGFSPEPIIRTGLGIIATRRSEIGDSKDAIVEKWLDSALRDDPGATYLLSLRADLFEQQKKYDEAFNIYEEILSRPDLNPFVEASTYNNIAFLLAIQEKDLTRAEEYISKAAAIHGPSSQVLDTRAVVHIARGNYAAAIDDLELAVTDNATAEMWFHLAYARKMAGQTQAALEAWDRGVDLELGLDKVNLMEHDRFKKLEKDLKAARASGGFTQTSPTATGRAA